MTLRRGFVIIFYNKKGSLSKAGGSVSKHIFLGETRLATVINDYQNILDNVHGYENDHVYYYHSDHLGSAQLVTDGNGDEYQRIEYTPYGESWLDIKINRGRELTPLSYKFCAKERDEETGLYYYGARYLDPKYSLWISADPAMNSGEYFPVAPTNDEAKRHNSNLPGMGGVYNTINFHLYHYAGNNPIVYSDPDGKAEKPSWIKDPDYCNNYSFTSYYYNPGSYRMDSITTTRNVEHFRISFSGTFEGHKIIFSGTKDIITNTIQGGAGDINSTITLIRLNINYDGKNYDYYALSVDNQTRFLFIPGSKQSKASQLVPDLNNDRYSLYNGEFNRDEVEKAVTLNAVLDLATKGFLGIVSTSDPLSQNILEAATQKLNETLSKEYKNVGSDQIKKDIEYLLP